MSNLDPIKTVRTAAIHVRGMLDGEFVEEARTRFNSLQAEAEKAGSDPQATMLKLKIMAQARTTAIGFIKDLCEVASIGKSDSMNTIAIKILDSDHYATSVGFLDTFNSTVDVALGRTTKP